MMTYDDDDDNGDDGNEYHDDDDDEWWWLIMKMATLVMLAFLVPVNLLFAGVDQSQAHLL